MSGEVSYDAIRNAARIIAGDHDRVTQLWRRRGLWQIKIRWIVPPLIVVAALAGRGLGFEFHLWPILAIAAVTLIICFRVMVSSRGLGVLRCTASRPGLLGGGGGVAWRFQCSGRPASTRPAHRTAGGPTD